MSPYSHIVLFILAVVLQLTIMPLFSVRDVSPDLIIIVVIAVTLQRGRVVGIWTGFAAGLLFDFFGSGFVGLSSLVNSLTAYLIGFMSGEQLARRWSVLMGGIFATLLLRDLLYFSLMTLGRTGNFWHLVLGNVFLQSCYTLAFIYIFHLIWPRALWGTTGRY
ncbi:MAG: rod shape-determining protein MreD [Calditrichaeota bacterium]|nr:MAG: rod shape-determining protein MreD [Calditrichota bacterium]